MRAQEFIIENADYMGGHCHVMALALQQLHPDWHMRARIGWDEDAVDDEDLRIDHIYIVDPAGHAYDCRGKFNSEIELLGPDDTGGAETQVVDVDPDFIQQQVVRGELKKFSAQDVAQAQQGVTEDVNNQRAHRGGIDLQASKEDGMRFQINATSHGRELGRVLFDVQLQGHDTILVAQDLMILPEYRGQGIAAIMYDYARELGYKVERSAEQTDAGRAFWDKNRGAGSKVWEQDVAENFADGKNPQDKGDSARHGIPKGATMAQLEKASHAKGRKGQLARWQLNMRRGKKK